MASRLKLFQQRRNKYLHSLEDLAPTALEIEIKNLKTLKLDRNYAKHFQCVLDVCVASRILGSHSGSPDDYARAQSCLQRACQGWVGLNVALTPYFHLSMHLFPSLPRNGPAHVTWAFGAERLNGLIGRLRTNGHTGGEVEATMARGWIKTQLLQDLVWLYSLRCQPRKRY